MLWNIHPLYHSSRSPSSAKMIRSQLEAHQRSCSLNVEQEIPVIRLIPTRCRVVGMIVTLKTLFTWKIASFSVSFLDVICKRLGFIEDVPWNLFSSNVSIEMVSNSCKAQHFMHQIHQWGVYNNAARIYPSWILNKFRASGPYVISHWRHITDQWAPAYQQYITFHHLSLWSDTRQNVSDATDEYNPIIIQYVHVCMCTWKCFTKLPIRVRCMELC